MPSKMQNSVICAETFIIHGRDTVAFATKTSVWLGWLRDTYCMQYDDSPWQVADTH